VCEEHFWLPSRCLLDAGFAPDVFAAMGDCTTAAAAAAAAVSAAAPVQELKQLSLGSPKDRAQGFVTTSGCSGDRRDGMLHKLSTGNSHDRAQVVAAAVASPDNIIAPAVMQQPRNNGDLKDRTRRLANGSHILVCNKRPPNSAQSSITNSTQSSHTTTSRSSYNTSTSLRSSNKQARVLLHPLSSVLVAVHSIGKFAIKESCLLTDM